MSIFSQIEQEGYDRISELEAELSRMRVIAVDYEHEIDALKLRNEKLEAALKGIERWCENTPGGVLYSHFVKGCNTPDAEAVLSSNIKNLAKTALAPQSTEKGK